jgi:hypothetical protein
VVVAPLSVVVAPLSLVALSPVVEAPLLLVALFDPIPSLSPPPLVVAVAVALAESPLVGLTESPMVLSPLSSSPAQAQSRAHVAAIRSVTGWRWRMGADTNRPGRGAQPRETGRGAASYERGA